VSPTEDEATSLTAIGGNAHHGAAFTTTHWSVVLQAQGDSPAAQEALEKLCRTYWWPLYGFVRRDGYSPDEAQDLTQGFFALILERRDLDAVRQEKGRLRSYLLTSLKHFLAKARRRELAVKRGAGQTLVTGFFRTLFRRIHFVNFSMQRAAADAEFFCGGGDVAIRGGKRLGNQSSFGLMQIERAGFFAERLCW